MPRFFFCAQKLCAEEVATELVKPATPVDSLQQQEDYECVCQSVGYERLEESCRMAPVMNGLLSARAIFEDLPLTLDRPLSDVEEDGYPSHNDGDSTLLWYLSGLLHTERCFL